MDRRPHDAWPVWRCLSLLAAVFAMAFGALAPAAVAASSATGHTVVLCSGARIQITDARIDVSPRLPTRDAPAPDAPIPDDAGDPSGLAAFSCAMALLSGAAAPPATGPAPLSRLRPRPSAPASTQRPSRPPAAANALRPPSTAPPAVS